MAMGFEAWARAVHEGSESFDDFARGTGERWRRLAQMIHRRWAQPGWVTLEDVVQDLLVGAWEAIWKWDRRRAPTIEGYLVWNAVDKAKKRAHKARGAVLHATADRNPSRFDIAMSCFSEDAEAAMMSECVVPPEQDVALEWADMVQRARGACRTEAEVLAVEALAEERSVFRAAARIYEDPDVRLRYRLGDEDKAFRFVERAAVVVAARVSEG